MTERPIIFNGAMSRASRAGLKTMTRRILPVQPPPGVNVAYVPGETRTRYGQPGDRLWVRETCRATETPDGLDGVIYMADGAFVPIKPTDADVDEWLRLMHYGRKGAKGKVVPAIHMPRWACRTVLHIDAMRIERLQDITIADCIAEGIPRGGPENPDGIELREFVELWGSINGPDSWDENPLVLVISFHVIEAK